MSDVVGFVLMFGIILTSVGLVATFGLSELESFNENQQLNNAERTFDLITRSFTELEESQATTRTDAIDLSGGSLTLSPSSSATVNVTADSGKTYTESFPLNALVYENNDIRIGYESGALFRVQERSDAGLITSGPGFVCSDGTAILSFVTLEGDTERQIGGEGTLRVTGRLADQTLLYPVSSSGTGNASTVDTIEVELTFSGESRAREWANYFENADGDWTVTGESDTSVTVQCGASTDLDSVYIRRSIISIAYS
ncbi:putative pilin/flagellin [Halapricum desulfuricans]|uniref:Putative pilin/flagellin n=1 Tax=Halapricum desulfuricans TaxID=2841257 RepID=A0A897NKU0_9EURY|nr:putative pilin/flagellin [Halapricum desulfuricans]